MSRDSLRSEKNRLNFDIYRGFIERFSLFWDCREALPNYDLYVLIIRFKSFRKLTSFGVKANLSDFILLHRFVK